LPDGDNQSVLSEPPTNSFQASLGCVAVVHFCTLDMRARTSNITAKSNFSQPIPRGGQKLVAYGGCGNGDVQLASQLHGQPHVFLHHVYVEPRFFWLLKDERTAVLESWATRSHCEAKRQLRILVPSRFFSPAAHFGKGQHLHRQAQVHRNLHG
jgi:hypothetical protein